MARLPLADFEVVRNAAFSLTEGSQEEKPSIDQFLAFDKDGSGVQFTRPTFSAPPDIRENPQHGFRAPFGVALPAAPKVSIFIGGALVTRHFLHDGKGIGLPPVVRVPTMLVMLREYLVTKGGIQMDGIFRLDRTGTALFAETKKKLNDGNFDGCSDLHVVASLLKEWLKDMPVSLFGPITEDDMQEISEMREEREALQGLMSAFSDHQLHLGTILWLLELMATVAGYQADNHMTERRVALVMSPYLYSMNSKQSDAALRTSQKVSEFTYVLLKSWVAYTRDIDNECD